MVLKHLVGIAIGHHTALLFAGGVATAVVGKKVVESGVVKDTTTKAMASVISMKRDAEQAAAEMKANAEEMANE